MEAFRARAEGAGGDFISYSGRAGSRGQVN